MASDHDDDNEPTSPPVQIDYRDPPPRLNPLSFVAARSPDSFSTPSASTPKAALGDNYLSLVLAAPSHAHAHATAPALAEKSVEKQANTAVVATVQCEICHLPLSSASDAKSHATSTAHQVCLQHTHVPSSLDRSRKGLQYLQSYGWDPDSRTGLGASRSGILAPIKPKEKTGKEGIGAVLLTKRQQREKVKKMGPKEIKKVEGQQRKRNDRLQSMFYTNGELEKYLDGVLYIILIPQTFIMEDECLNAYLIHNKSTLKAGCVESRACFSFTV